MTRRSLLARSLVHELNRPVAFINDQDASKCVCNVYVGALVLGKGRCRPVCLSCVSGDNRRLGVAPDPAATTLSQPCPLRHCPLKSGPIDLPDVAHAAWAICPEHLEGMMRDLLGLTDRADGADAASRFKEPCQAA